MEDSFLIHQTLAGQRDAFRFLVLRHQRSVFRFLAAFIAYLFALMPFAAYARENLLADPNSRQARTGYRLEVRRRLRTVHEQRRQPASGDDLVDGLSQTLSRLCDASSFAMLVTCLSPSG
jgi:hypothetical protein